MLRPRISPARWIREVWLLDTNVKPTIEDFLEELAQSSCSALLLDYDGTLAPFHTDRDHALPYPGVAALLQEIMNTGHTRVVLITGRPAHDVVPLLRLVPPPEIWGVYGLQRLKPDGTCEMRQLDEAVARALEGATRWVNELGFGNLVEVKPGSVAVHWRGLEDSEAARIRGTVLLGWLPIAERARMTLQDFDGGVEMVMSDCNKGDAVREFLATLNSAVSIAYLGDDQADEEAFRALQNRGLRILVRPEWRETAADVWLRPPEELVDFLFQWLTVLPRREVSRP
jgi:trehalose 6-phosphate phosphatase